MPNIKTLGIVVSNGKLLKFHFENLFLPMRPKFATDKKYFNIY